jgi:hypothetical protein
VIPAKPMSVNASLAKDSALRTVKYPMVAHKNAVRVLPQKKIRILMQ